MARTLDQLIASENPDVVNRAKEKADAMLLELRLSEVRRLVEMTQAEMADALGVKQPTIAGMEKSGQDLRLSSLKRYVEAIGGKVRVDIQLPDGTHHGFSL
ncbi:Cro/Cl family transcriptional regulator [Ectothiorhodospira haloalkaliphila]|uniref:Cro/Cl family transcriptional regulator n=1 Tax=Ectothiorhodospira haloalkaliphila TaxID=421628 RepID=W8KMX4_9GAMM|nr:MULTISPECIES: helix-turn-helix domain-containing protein [Ectothiorhodospira]AHK80523.1 Cro/Cl family transcriptional regulator [Ectothiorhodospira haloalkaliphila]MCG5494667.1 helix-turn-helix domain-containing protein [Ectothiorhodospira variabilis]MCG5499071.1 helix-turn-helix domain-containing protein [Ectothiorhodospira variabilis]MCG5505111.1 helix-turn-helix domain-containing protein [Ectothiorhodospira variabilis]MCG5508268.1 helix-turn-helix domain-containing protein [Ectothiorhodo